MRQRRPGTYGVGSSLDIGFSGQLASAVRPQSVLGLRPGEMKMGGGEKAEEWWVGNRNATAYLWPGYCNHHEPQSAYIIRWYVFV